VTLRVIAGTLEKDPPSELAARRRLARLGIDGPAITPR